jgi:hypothetical protein
MGERQIAGILRLAAAVAASHQDSPMLFQYLGEEAFHQGGLANSELPTNEAEPELLRLQSRAPQLVQFSQLSLAPDERFGDLRCGVHDRFLIMGMTYWSRRSGRYALFITQPHIISHLFLRILTRYFIMQKNFT